MIDENLDEAINGDMDTFYLTFLSGNGIVFGSEIKFNNLPYEVAMRTN